jgi:hypothetical protein
MGMAQEHQLKESPSFFGYKGNGPREKPYARWMNRPVR